MRNWLLPIVAGLIIGAISVFAPALLNETDDLAGMEDLAVLSREEAHKKIETKRIEAVRLASDQRYNEAISIFLYLIDINHHDHFAYVQLARVLRDIGDDAFFALLDDTNNPGLVYDLDRIKGAVYYQVGDIERSSQYIDRFIERHPGDLAATFYKGSLARKEGRFDEAERLLTDVVTREPSYFFAYLELIDLYEEKGDEVKAKQANTLAWKFNPANNKEGVCCGLPLTEKQKKV
jgi:tetratricopeptide (TPR) repeat protein